VRFKAAVSHAFLYNHPELRKRIEHLRGRPRANTTVDTPAESESTLVIALTQRLADLKKQHHRETQALRAALERAHGENLDLRRELARRGPASAPPENGHVASIATTN
jgi:hypothetical protein